MNLPNNIPTSSAKGVKFPNNRSQLAEIYRPVRGFVRLSTKESVSLSALEAEACECPLLLSDLPWARTTFYRQPAIARSPGPSQRRQKYCWNWSMMSRAESACATQTTDLALKSVSSSRAFTKKSSLGKRITVRELLI